MSDDLPVTRDIPITISNNLFANPMTQMTGDNSRAASIFAKCMPVFFLIYCQSPVTSQSLRLTLGDLKEEHKVNTADVGVEHS